MNLYLIVPTTQQHQTLDAAIQKSVGTNAYALPNGETLVAFNGTSKDLSDLLGVSDGDAEPAIVAAIGGYYGRAATDIWEWMKVRLEQ